MLRHYLLFFDDIDYPYKGGMEINGLGPRDEMDYLMHAGVLRRTGFDFELDGSAEDAPKVKARPVGVVAFSGDGKRIDESPPLPRGGHQRIANIAHSAIFEMHEKAEPGVWSLEGDGRTDFARRQRPQGKGRELLVRLYNCIAIPDVTAPLAEVLKFREKRRDELLSLRNHVEELYLNVISSPDRNLSETITISKLEKSLADHLKAISEERFPIRLSGMDISAETELSLLAPAVAAAAAFQFGLVASILAGAAGLAGQFLPGAKLKLSYGTIEHNISKTPLKYVARARNQLSELAKS